MTFWIAAAALVLIVLALMLYGLLRPMKTADTDHMGHDISVYKDQLDEIDRDVERGLLAGEQAAASKLEIQRRLLSAREQDTAESKGKDHPELAKIMAGLVAIVIPVGAVTLYMELGSPTLPDRPFAQRQDIPATSSAARGGAAQQQQAGDLSQMADNLAAKLKERPDDLQGHLLLAGAYMEINRFAEADKIFARAYELSGRSPQVAADWAEALIFLHDGQVGTRAQELLKHAVEKSPLSPKPRFYLAVGATQAKAYERALRQWKNLLLLSEPGVPWVATVNRNIADVVEASGLNPDDVAADPQLAEQAKEFQAVRAKEAAEQPAVPGPSAEDVAAAQDMSAEDRTELIASMVERLADKLKENPDDLEGWLRLANAYSVMGQAADSATAYGKAAALNPGDAGVAKRYEDALWNAGLDEAGAGRVDAARALLQKLLERRQSGTPEYDDVKKAIDVLG